MAEIMIASKSHPVEDEILKIYRRIKRSVADRIDEFKVMWEAGEDEDIFFELVFCLLTPASRAHSAWEAVQRLKGKNLLFTGSPYDMRRIAQELSIVRFKNKKASFIAEAAAQFYGNGRFSLRKKLLRFEYTSEKREWLVSSVRGMGYKEASHFLRNVGFLDVAILDRHILKNLILLSVIEAIPSGLSKTQYLAIEGKMKNFSLRIGIPLSHLDFVLWYKETGAIFK